jgi:hypothetical protein
MMIVKSTDILTGLKPNVSFLVMLLLIRLLAVANTPLNCQFCTLLNLIQCHTFISAYNLQ